jgi:hypothetical protein
MLPAASVPEDAGQVLPGTADLVTAATEVSRLELTLPAAPEAVELTGAAAEMVPSIDPESMPVSAAPDGAEKANQATAKVPAKSTGRTALNDTNDVAMQHPLTPWSPAVGPGFLRSRSQYPRDGRARHE